MALVRFAARDPGGANGLAGFLTRHAPKLNFDLWTLPKATAVFARAGFIGREFPEDFTKATVVDAWQRLVPAKVVTGTSHYAAFEPLLWQLAREQGCPSLAVNDSWANLAPRFQWGKPDWVGAVDAGQVAELMALGFGREQIIETGHPWLALLLERRQAILSEPLPASPGPGVRVLFISESISSDVAQGVNAPFGFDEFDAFALVYQAAFEVGTPDFPVELAIKFHPYEDPAPFLTRLQKLPRKAGLRVMPLERQAQPLPWVRWADLVTGISSMLMLEAIVLDRPVLSVQPGLRREDTFIASRRGFAELLTEPAPALSRLQTLLADPEVRRLTVQRNQKFLETIPRDPFGRILDWILEPSTG